MSQTTSKRLHPPENIDWISNYIDENKSQRARNRLFFQLHRRPPTLAQSYASLAEQILIKDNFKSQRRITEKEQRAVYAKMLKEYGETEDFYDDVPLQQEEESLKLEVLEKINLNAFQTGLITDAKYKKEKAMIDTERERSRKRYEKIQQESLLWKGKFDQREDNLRRKFNAQLARLDRRIEKIQGEIDKIWGRIDDDVEWYRTDQDLSGVFGAKVQ